MKKTILIPLLILALYPVIGCESPYHRPYLDMTTIETAKEIIDSLQTTNTLSTGINPFAIPIGAGLAGISAVLATIAEHKRKEANKQSKQMLKTVERKINGNG